PGRAWLLRSTRAGGVPGYPCFLNCRHFVNCCAEIFFLGPADIPSYAISLASHGEGREREMVGSGGRRGNGDGRKKSAGQAGSSSVKRTLPGRLGTGVRSAQRGLTSRPRNSRLRVWRSRMRNRKGWSALKTGPPRGLILVPVTAAAVAPFSLTSTT